MNEAKARREVFNLMRRLWLWPVTQTDASICPHGHLVRPPRGRPDILVLNPQGPAIVVEAKMFDLDERAFSFRRIDDGQRQWLNNWEEDGGTAFLALGTRTGRAGSKSPRYLWLVDWPAWLRVEKSCVKLGQLSLPLELHRARRRDLRDAGISAVNLLEGWALVWRDSCWHLRESHPLTTLTRGRGERDLGEERKRWNGAKPVRTLKVSSVSSLASSGTASTHGTPTER